MFTPIVVEILTPNKFCSTRKKHQNFHTKKIKKTPKIVLVINFCYINALKYKKKANMSDITLTIKWS